MFWNKETKFNKLKAVGIRCFATAQYAEAIAKLSAAIAIKQDDAEVYNYLGSALFFTGSYSLALNSLKNAVSIAPESINLLTDLALVYEKLQSFDEAIKIYDQIFDKSDNKPALQSRLGNCYFEKKEFDKAKDYLKDSLNADAENASAHYTLGLIHIEQDNRKAALLSKQMLELLFSPLAATLMAAINNKDWKKPEEVDGSTTE